jgi:hypothetical protein
VDSLISRREAFATVGSTNDVVRTWLADGTPEVCLAVADEQTADVAAPGAPDHRARPCSSPSASGLPAGAGPCQRLAVTSADGRHGRGAGLRPAPSA